MSSTPSDAHHGATLGEDVALLGEIAARIGARVEAGEHLGLDGVSQAGLAAELLRSGGLAEACAAAAVRAAHRSGDLRTSGFFSVKGFLVDGVGVSTGQAVRVGRLGIALEQFPVLRVGLLSGLMGADAVRAAADGVTTAVADLRGSARDDARAAGEAILAPLCRVAPVVDVERAAAALVFRLDPESAARRALEALERREVVVGRVGTAAVVRMVLDAMTGAQLVTLLETRVDQWYRTGSLPEDARPTGDDAEDERRAALARPRMLADAFAEIVGELLVSSAVGTRNGAPVAVSVLVSQDVHAAGGPGDLLVPGRDPVPVPAQTVERVLCDADVTEIHMHRLVEDRSSLGPVAPGDHPGDPHDLTGQCAHVHCVGRRSRTATRDQRAALAVRDRHCRFPGCRTDASRCDAHHVRTWSAGGSTCLSNLVLLCSRHHSLLHEGRWRLTADPALDPGHPDRWRFTPPPTGYVGRDGALVAERIRRGLPPEPPAPPPPDLAAA